MKQIKLKRLINNHAFTLVELLAVIIILGVLSSIVISLGMNYINKAKEQAYYLLINSIETTTRLYIDDYRDIIDNIDEPGQEISITLGDLISKEMLTEPVIDPRNDISIPLDTKIYIYVLGNNRYDIKFSYSDENLSSYYLFPKNNLILHLDAANIINLDNGDMVTQWDDLSPKKIMLRNLIIVLSLYIKPTFLIIKRLFVLLIVI